jgi:23S rRNA (cytidine1920-2'-O)/16S rRNA (cytidine1409-2'-O)-methyltransferase
MLEWKLRKDERVVVMERTNAMHVELPERVDVVTVDVGWTTQRHILPSALGQLRPGGFILSLFKPQYEAEPRLVHGGVVDTGDFMTVLDATLAGLEDSGIRVRQVVRLPHERESKNPEAILYICPADCSGRWRRG